VDCDLKPNCILC